MLVGAAVGAGPLELKRAEAILKEQINLIVVDTAHGHSKKVAEIVKAIKKIKTKKTTLCAGNIATADAAKFLIKLGVDIVKVGIGPGSICTTRMVAGIGVPQITAIMEVSKALKGKNVWHRVIKEIDKAYDPNFYELDRSGTPLHWYRGVANFSMGKQELAFKDFLYAHKLNPNHLHVLNNLATIYELKGDRKNAIYYYSRALEISPKFEESASWYIRAS